MITSIKTYLPMADTSTPSDKSHRPTSGSDAHILPIGNHTNMLPDRATLRFLRDFARSYNVVSALPSALSSFIAN
ncbi:MAG: hypothetical protein HDR92_10635 [Bacteroides sp.]|nr:hypothetical protein [Bacteroides sp.]MBD5347564.1 hypothetical protein [Bacteroides sp.]